MATMMASKGGFQLCEKRTTYVQVSGVMSQVGVTYKSPCTAVGGSIIGTAVPQQFFFRGVVWLRVSMLWKA